MEEKGSPRKPATDRVELAIRHTIGSIMSGRADVDQVVARLVRQGFQPTEIEVILNEASRRMSAVGKAANREFYRTAIGTGALLLLMAVGIVSIAGFPEHGRGVGVFYTAVLFGLGALAYGIFGKIFGR